MSSPAEPFSVLRRAVGSIPKFAALVDFLDIIFLKGTSLRPSYVGERRNGSGLCGKQASFSALGVRSGTFAARCPQFSLDAACQPAQAASGWLVRCFRYRLLPYAVPDVLLKRNGSGFAPIGWAELKPVLCELGPSGDLAFGMH